MRSIVHRWVRQPNLDSSVTKRVGNRFNPFQNTLTVLEDPVNNRKLYLIGTTNSSTTLAYRTRKLLNEVSANALYVQANQKWWSSAKHTSVTKFTNLGDESRGFQSGQQIILIRIIPLRKQSSRLTIQNEISCLDFFNEIFIQYLIFYSGFPTDFRPFSPGL